MSAQMIRMCSIIGPPEVEPRVRQLRQRITSPRPQSPGVAARSSKGSAVVSRSGAVCSKYTKRDTRVVIVRCRVRA